MSEGQEGARKECPPRKKHRKLFFTHRIYFLQGDSVHEPPAGKRLPAKKERKGRRKSHVSVGFCVHVLCPDSALRFCTQILEFGVFGARKCWIPCGKIVTVFDDSGIFSRYGKIRGRIWHNPPTGLLIAGDSFDVLAGCIWDGSKAQN